MPSSKLERTRSCFYQPRRNLSISLSEGRGMHGFIATDTKNSPSPWSYDTEAIRLRFCEASLSQKSFAIMDFQVLTWWVSRSQVRDGRKKRSYSFPV